MKRLTIIICMLLTVFGCVTGSVPTSEQLANERFADCPYNHQEQIKDQLSRGLFDPYSAMYRFGVPEKFVYQGQFGYKVMASVNAKNRFGGYVGEQTHMFMCFPDGTVREINTEQMDFLRGMQKGLR